MPDADVLDPAGNVVGTLTVPEGASPELLQQMSQRAMVAMQARAVAAQEGIDPDLFTRVVQQESQFDVTARSPKGAFGPAQLMPDTATKHGVDLRDPIDNLRGGARELKGLLEQYNGDVPRALAGYNAGVGAVAKYGGVPPYPETQDYIARVTGAPPSELPIGAPPPRAPDPRMPLVTTALAGEGAAVDRMPRVTTAFAGEGPRAVDIPDVNALVLKHMDDPDNALPWYQRAIEPLTELLVQGDRAVSGSSIPALPARRLAADALQTELLGAGFLLPGAATYRAAAGMGAAYNAVSEAVEEIRQGLTPDWKRVGMATLLGGATGGVLHGVTNTIFGAPAPARRAAEETLGLTGIRAPVPGTPAFAAHVDEVLEGALPAASRDAVNAAYDGFRQEVGGRTIDVTAYNRVLDHYNAVRFPGERLAAPQRLLDPVGRAFQIGTAAPRWVASVEEVLASERGLNFAARARGVSGERTLPGGLMQSLQGDLAGALNRSLTPGEQAAYTEAREAARALAQRERAVRLVTTSTAAEGGVTDVARLARTLERRPEKFTQALGPALYQQLTTLAQAGRTLLTQPGGQVLFKQLLTRLPGAALGAVMGGQAGGLGGYGREGRALGALTGAAIPPSQLFTPAVLSALERLARTRATAGHVAEGAGRLAVALALDATPDPRTQAPPTGVLPFASTPPTPRPLGLGAR